MLYILSYMCNIIFIYIYYILFILCNAYCSPSSCKSFWIRVSDKFLNGFTYDTLSLMRKRLNNVKKISKGLPSLLKISI